MFPSSNHMNKSNFPNEHSYASGIMHPWAEYIDIEPVQWQRWYDLLLKPNRHDDTLYILHDQGQILTVNPAWARTLVSLPLRIESPFTLVEKLHAEWGRGSVVVIERGRFNVWLDRIQRSLTPGDDFLSCLLRFKDHYLRESDDGIVIYPRPWMHWKSIAPDLPTRLGWAISPGHTPGTVLFVAYERAEIWVSLLLGFQDSKVKFVTTLSLEIQPAQNGDWRVDYKRLLSVAEGLFAPVSLGVFCQRETFEKLGIGPDHWVDWIDAVKRGEVICDPGHLDELVTRMASASGR